MKKIIGYSDDNGYTYCQKHVNAQMDAIYDNDDSFLFERCEICGEFLTNDIN